MHRESVQKPQRCGLGKCHPDCLQTCLNIQSFTFFLCVFAVLSGMFPMYLVSQITTIEKHFGFSSKRSGMIVSCGEIGFLLTVIFVGHFLNTSHRPRVLAGCAFVIATASLMMTIPFFVYGTPHKHDGTEETASDSLGILCLSNTTHKEDSGCRGSSFESSFKHEDAAFGIFILASILAGCGGTGLWSLGIAYLDDNADKKKSALYLGLVMCLRSIAPVFGLIFGAGVSYISVDLQDHHLSPDHTSWIGAWWIGFLAIGIITYLTGIPLLFYPKRLPAFQEEISEEEMIARRQRSRRQSVVERVAEEGKTLVKSFPKSVWKLLKNPVFVLLVLGTVVDVAGSVGYYSFGPKYIETQFHVKTFDANIITAAIVLSSAIGLGVSGAITSRIKMRLNDLFIRVTISLGVCYVLFLVLMAFGCSEIEITGLSTTSNNTGTPSFINQTCHSHCHCPDGPYSPVCGSDGLTYFSPCHAGCITKTDSDNYVGCGCVGSEDKATSGACSSGCNMVIAYAVFLCVLNFVIGINTMPFLMLTLRCVDEKDKSLALALINIAISIGIVPIPVLYGSLVDSLCVLTSPGSCGGSDDSSCLIYDNYGMRTKLHSLTFGIRFFCIIFYVVCWYLCRNKVFAGDEKLAKKEGEALGMKKVDENEIDGEAEKSGMI